MKIRVLLGDIMGFKDTFMGSIGEISKELGTRCFTFRMRYEGSTYHSKMLLGCSSRENLSVFLVEPYNKGSSLENRNH